MTINLWQPSFAYALTQICKSGLHYFEAIPKHIISFLLLLEGLICSLGQPQIYDPPVAVFQVLDGTTVFQCVLSDFYSAVSGNKLIMLGYS